MVQLVLIADLNHQFPQWDSVTVPVKKPSGMQWKSDLTSRDMRMVVMKTTEPDFTREATEILLKILDSTYAKADIKQVADNATQLNYEERTQLLMLLKYFQDLFDGTIGDWYTEPVDLKLKPGSKPLDSKYYPVLGINKETFSQTS